VAVVLLPPSEHTTDGQVWVNGGISSLTWRTATCIHIYLLVCLLASVQD
jgi:hypothetical protein